MKNHHDHSQEWHLHLRGCHNSLVEIERVANIFVASCSVCDVAGEGVTKENAIKALSAEIELATYSLVVVSPGRRS